MSEQDIIQYLSSRRFTVLWSGGKDSTATLLWVLNNIQHEDFNVLYVEVTGNTHYLNIQYVYDVARELGIKHKLIHAKREIDFYEHIKKWGIPGPTWSRRWCTREFKQKLFRKYSYRIQVLGVKHSDSYRRKKIMAIDKFHSSDNIVVKPIIRWSTKQVLQYIKQNDIPLCECYKLFGHSGNCMFCPFHSTHQIVRTLNDPEFGPKIIDALLSQRSPKVQNYVAYRYWKRAIGQTTLVSSHFSEKS